LLEFRHTDNTTWLIERRGFVTTAQLQQKQLQTADIAASASIGCPKYPWQYKSKSICMLPPRTFDNPINLRQPYEQKNCK
jgi:hypothetical protein